MQSENTDFMQRSSADRNRCQNELPILSILPNPEPKVYSFSSPPTLTLPVLLTTCSQCNSTRLRHRLREVRTSRAKIELEQSNLRKSLIGLANMRKHLKTSREASLGDLKPWGRAHYRCIRIAAQWRHSLRKAWAIASEYYTRNRQVLLKGSKSSNRKFQRPKLQSLSFSPR